jgi:hypothetical protein
LIVRNRRVAIALLLFVVLTRGLLERRMYLHMLVQLPMLMLAGGLLSGEFWLRTRRSSPQMADWNVAGAAGLLLAATTVAFWMIPRMLDTAVEQWPVDVLKAATLIVAGIMGRWSWLRATTLVRVFIAGNSLWMTATVGMLLLDAPVRLCAQYGTADQNITGYSLLCATVMGVVTALVVASGPARSSTSERAESVHHPFAG